MEDEDNKFLASLPEDMKSSELVTARVMKFITETAEDLEIHEADVTVASLITLTLSYLKNRSDNKAEAVAHLMSLLCSVLLITSANTSWVDVADTPTEKEKN